MSIETAVFAVQRGDQQFSCKGIDLNGKVLAGDLFAVQRGDTSYKGTSNKVQDTDLLACTDTDGVTYKVTGAQFKSLFKSSQPWEGADAIYHVIVTDSITNPNDIAVTGKDKIYNLTNQAEVPYINRTGEWIITGVNTKFTGSNVNWEFGDLTDTSNVTDMSEMFSLTPLFNSDLTTWDVGNVTNMHSMFFNAFNFNSDISNWNVSNVTDMALMFYNAEKFNSDISNWDVGNVKDMHQMFYHAIPFNQDIGNWDVGNVTDMYGMFFIAEAFNKNISNWDVGNVTNMPHMFRDAKRFSQNLTSWCVTDIKSSPTLFRTGSKMPINGSYDPKWGTCP